MFIDAHAHLTSAELFPQAEELIRRAEAAGVKKIINICTDPLSLERGLALAENYPQILNTAATTPHDVEQEGELFFPVVKAAATQHKLAAIGETGLDYHYHHSPKDTQIAYLIRYFQLALATDLPLVFHCRDAFADLFALADKEYQSPKAVLHCFTGTLAEAKQVLERGWLISFSGIVTFRKSEALRDVVRYVPLDRMLIETDAPYLAPQSHRGKPNEPSFLPETAQLIAHTKNLPLDLVARTTTQTAESFFLDEQIKK